MRVCCDLSQATLEHRKLAVDLAEIIVKWESQRIKEENEEVAGQVININYIG